METGELQCKLEQMALGMGVELNSKFCQEINPIYGVLRTIIILGFLTFLIIISLLVFIKIYSPEKREIKIETKEIIRYRDRSPEYYFKEVDLVKVKIIKERKYFYYKREINNKEYFFTKAIPIKDL